MVAALASGAWYDFFLTEPYQRFTISDPSDDVEATVLLVVISLAVTEIALWGHRQQARAARRSGYLDGVLGAARAGSRRATSRTGPSPVDVVASQIAVVLGAESCRYVEGPVQDPRVAVLDHEGVLLRRSPSGRRGPGRPAVGRVRRRTRSAGGRHVLGHFLVSTTGRVAYPTPEQRRVAVLLAAQVAPTAAGGPPERAS